VGGITQVVTATGQLSAVVSVDVGDVRERLKGVTCSCVAPKDPRALGRALAEALNPPRRSDGRRRADEFSSVRIAQELGRLYHEVLEERGR